GRPGRDPGTAGRLFCRHRASASLHGIEDRRRSRGEDPRETEGRGGEEAARGRGVDCRRRRGHAGGARQHARRPEAHPRGRLRSEGMMAAAIHLYDYQQRWLRDRERFKIGMFCRQSGKTFSTTLEIVDSCLEAEANGGRERWVILSRGERQAKEAMDEG